MLLVDGRPEEHLVGYVVVEDGLAGPQHEAETGVRVELLGLELAQARGHLEPRRVDVGDRDALSPAVRIEQVHPAPVGDLRHGESRDVAQRLLVVQGGGEHGAGAGQEVAAQLHALAHRDVLDDRDGSLDLALRIAHRLQEHPGLRSGPRVDRPHCQRAGNLAAQQTHRGKVVHVDLAAVLAEGQVAAHQSAGIGVAQLVHRGEAHALERRAVGVDDAVVPAPDRDRLRQRVDDRLEALLAPREGLLELIEQPLALGLLLPSVGDVGDERMKREALTLRDRRDDQFDRELAAVGPHGALFAAVIQQPRVTSRFEAPEAAAQRLAVALRDDQVNRALAENLLAAAPEGLFGADVPIGDAALFVHRDEGAVGDVEDLASVTEIHPRDDPRSRGGMPSGRDSGRRRSRPPGGRAP